MSMNRIRRLFANILILSHPILLKRLLSRETPSLMNPKKKLLKTVLEVFHNISLLPISEIKSNIQSFWLLNSQIVSDFSIILIL